MASIVGWISVAGIIPPQAPCAEITKPREASRFEQEMHEWQAPDRRDDRAMLRSERLPVPSPKQHVGNAHPNPAHGWNEEGDWKNNEKDMQIDLARYQSGDREDLNAQWGRVPFLVCRHRSRMKLAAPTARLFDRLIAHDNTRGVSKSNAGDCREKS